MRNYEKEQKIVKLCDSYREKKPKYVRGWLAIAGTVDLSRNAIYDIFNSEADVRRDTVILFCLALEMSLDDFITMYNYKGYYLREFDYREMIIAKFIKNSVYDTETINQFLEDNGEDPLSNCRKPNR